MAVTTQPPRREQVLAFIIERIARDGVSPSVREIARALDLSCTRVRQLIEQLIRAGWLERRPGAQRGLVVRDVAGARTLLTEVLARMGWAAEAEIDAGGCPQMQLPRLPPIEHLPGDWPEVA